MSTEKLVIIDQIEVVGEFKAVQVRQATHSIQDGAPVGDPAYCRWVITAGQDYSDEPEEVQAVCAEVHTLEVVEAYAKEMINGRS